MKKVVEFYVRDARGVDVLLGKVVSVGSLGRSNLTKMGESIGITGWNYAVCGSERMYIHRGEKDGVVSSGNISEFVMHRDGFLLGLRFVEGYVLEAGVDVPRVKGWSYPVIEEGGDDLEPIYEVGTPIIGNEAPTGSEGIDGEEEEVKPKPRAKVVKKADDKPVVKDKKKK